MTTEEFIKSHAEAAFGEGNAKHGYHRSDNFEASGHKLRHAFWKDATFAPIQNSPGVFIAKLKSGTERIVFSK